MPTKRSVELLPVGAVLAGATTDVRALHDRLVAHEPATKTGRKLAVEPLPLVASPLVSPTKQPRANGESTA